jgi:hemerythrin-like domain-containing protein
MNFSRRVSRALDDEHHSDLSLLDKVEQALVGSPRHDTAHAGLMAQFAAALEQDIERHFLFEEASLFPLR